MLGLRPEEPLAWQMGPQEKVFQAERMCGKDRREVREWEVALGCQSGGGGSGRKLWKMSLHWSQGHGRQTLDLLLSLGNREPLLESF